MTYPKECPIFRVSAGGPFIRKGGIVEAIGIESAWTPDGEEWLPFSGQIQIRVLSGARDRKRVGDTLGFAACSIGYRSVEPLTEVAWQVYREVEQGYLESVEEGAVSP